MKIFPYWGTQIGFGFAIWETGAEIFLPYVMLRLMYGSNKFLRIVLRPLLWFKKELEYPSWKEREDRQEDYESEYPVRPISEWVGGK